MIPEDHDLLVKHSVKLNAICASQSKSEKTIADFIDKIDKRCDKRKDDTQMMQEKTMRTSTFWRIVTVLVAILLVMGASMGLNREMATRNEIQIMNNTKLIERNGIMLNKIIQDIIPHMIKE